ncbi:endoplasmin-like [Dysidea avara]|uniref:endoplasmin-like n=1 Tax=Dysidea avara TaxID=196820 RepID=UPI00331C5AEE
MGRRFVYVAVIGLLLCLSTSCLAQEEEEEYAATADEDLGASREASRTDDEAVKREEEAIQLDGLSVAEMKQLRDSAEKFAFQAEVNRMMKLIINSLYRNKEIFLRELISNASDALDKIRFLSLTDKSALQATEELSIKIKADKEAGILHVTDTGIGMTRADLANNLGTIAKSGTTEFLEKVQGEQTGSSVSDLIGQFGVGFYSTFLVADTVMVTSKHNEDKQYIWESNGSEFSIAEDPRGNSLLRGTTISLFMKEEAQEYLDQSTLKDLIRKYSQFINFPIYLWDSKTETIEEPIEEDEEAEETPTEKPEETEEEDDDDEEIEVEEEKEEKPKTKTVEKTIWDWVLMNEIKPIWLRNPKDVTDEEYNEFYKAFSKDYTDPMTKIHFTAEGEVTFKCILYVPKSAPPDMFQNYGKIREKIKLYVRRVFITDDFEDMLPKYLNFIHGVVDSDDLPLNVSRETLQQHKLLKVIKKKLVRKALDMFKKMDDETYESFWKEFSTNMKLGIMEDPSNRTRLSKLLRFQSSNDSSEQTSLQAYIDRMKEKQEHIYFIAGSSRSEVEGSPFVERLLKKGFEVLYLVEPIDEHTIQNLPDFDGKKFQNAAKEGLDFGEQSEEQKEQQEALEKSYEPLTKWLQEEALKEQIEKAVVSHRLTTSPCALVAGQYGWTGNMERIMKSQAYAKSDGSSSFYMNQKKTLEINPRHPLMKELLRRVENEDQDQTTTDLANVLFDTAVLRSGYDLKESVEFAGRIERMMRLSLGVDLDAEVDPFDEGDDSVEDDEEEITDEEEVQEPEEVPAESEAEEESQVKEEL